MFNKEWELVGWNTDGSMKIEREINNNAYRIIKNGRVTANFADIHGLMATLRRNSIIWPIDTNLN